MRSRFVLLPKPERPALTNLADDPLALNVKNEALWLLEVILAERPPPFDQEGFVRIAERVWVEQTVEGGVGCDLFFQFTFDPFDGAETGTLKTLTLHVPEQNRFAANCELLTTDQEDLFWWAIWLSDFRSSLTIER